MDVLVTDAQIESAARELCRAKGYDPDGKPEYPLPPYPAPTWKVFEHRVREFLEIGTALAAVGALPEQPAPASRRRKPTGK